VAGGGQRWKAGPWRWRVTCQDIVEGGLDVGGVEGRGLDETKVVLLREGLGLVRGDGAQVPQVRLVPHLSRNRS
jgi:hypothetical protein